METTSPETKPSQEAWEAAAEKIYEKRRADDENVAHVHSVFEEEKESKKFCRKTVNSLKLFKPARGAAQDPTMAFTSRREVFINLRVHNNFPLSNAVCCFWGSGGPPPTPEPTKKGSRRLFQPMPEVDKVNR